MDSLLIKTDDDLARFKKASIDISVLLDRIKKDNIKFDGCVLDKLRERLDILESEINKYESH